MNFDFYHQYKDYSNTDLLKIVQRPDQYQADAVNAASKILNEREVSETDIEQAKAYQEELDNKATQRAAKIKSYKNKATDFFEPVIYPSAEVKPEKWLNILLAIIVIQYLWTLYINIRDFSRFIKHVIDCRNFGFDSSATGTVSYWTCFSNQFDLFILFQLLAIIYVPIIFYLLYKRKKWGWILLFADNVFVLISTLSQSYIFFKYQQIHHGDTVSFFSNILIKGLFVFFLWRNYISDFFSVSKEVKKKTLIVTTVITVSFILSIQIFI